MNNTKEAAGWYIERSFAPIPIPEKSKNPNRPNWQNERWTIEDVPRLWDNGQNIGILNGTPSGGRVTVDCDCPETVRLAPKFLAPTLKGGRDTVPSSHWWYSSPGCPTLALKDVDGKRILELRADGCQTVVSPSKHPDGDTYRWYRDLSNEIVQVVAGDLVHQVQLLHTAALIARHMPPIGARHDYALALAGFLLRNGRFTEDDARRVMLAAWGLFEDAGREALRDVESSVATTSKRLEEKKPVRGGGALGIFNERLTKAIADGWGWRLAGEEDTSYVWGEPEELPENLPPVPEFDYRILPETFGGWVQDVSERMQVPPDFVAAPLMVAFSTVVGRQVGIRPKREDDWLVVPNLWGAIVGSPGLLKSPALKEALAPMNALIAGAMDAHADSMAEYESEKEISEARQEWYVAEKKKLAKKGDMAALQSFMESNRPEDTPEEPTQRRFRTEDVTVEKLAELLNQNPNGIMVHRDELVGFLRSLDRYGREGDRQFYLEGWNGDQGFTVDRIGRGTLNVEALCISLLGGIQPGPLSRYVHDAGQGSVDDDGLLQRFQMLVWPDHPQEWNNIDRAPSLIAKTKLTKIFETANSLSYDKPDDASIPYLKFSTEAQDIFDVWRGDLEREVRSGDLSPAMEAHKSKYRSLFPSLALLIEIADSASEGETATVVSESSAIKARAWCTYLEDHAKRLYFSAERPEMRSARELVKKLKAGKIDHGIPTRMLYKNEWAGLKDKFEVEGALEVLGILGWLRVHRFESGGRPSEVVLLHPELRRAL